MALETPAGWPGYRQDDLEAATHLSGSKDALNVLVYIINVMHTYALLNKSTQ